MLCDVSRACLVRAETFRCRSDGPCRSRCEQVVHCPGQALSDATSSEYWLLPSIDSCGVGLPLTYPTADDPTGFVRLVGDDADLSD